MRVLRAAAEDWRGCRKKKSGGRFVGRRSSQEKRNQERLDAFFVTPAFATVAFVATFCFADSTNDAVQAL